MFYTYVLFSQKDKGLYIGYTSNLKQRLLRHYDGFAFSTKSRRPFKLIYYEADANKYDALMRS